MTSLASDKTPHTFIRITNFYTRFATLQFLTTLLHKRRFQSYLLTAPAGPGSVMMGMVIFSIGAQIKAASLFKVQKVPAFEGAFEILFNTVSQERGGRSSYCSRSFTTCKDGLVRFRSSNHRRRELSRFVG